MWLIWASSAASHVKPNDKSFCVSTLTRIPYRTKVLVITHGANNEESGIHFLVLTLNFQKFILGISRNRKLCQCRFKPDRVATHQLIIWSSSHSHQKRSSSTRQYQADLNPTIQEQIEILVGRPVAVWQDYFQRFGTIEILSWPLSISSKRITGSN